MAEAPAVQPAFVSYCIQRTDRPDAAYTLFWVQDSSLAHTLAMVVSLFSASQYNVSLIAHEAQQCSSWSVAVHASGKRCQAQQEVEI